MMFRYVYFEENQYMRNSLLPVNFDFTETGGITLAVQMRFTVPAVKKGEDKPLRIVFPTPSGCVALSPLSQLAMHCARCAMASATTASNSCCRYACYCTVMHIIEICTCVPLSYQ